jgi:hypothetical protein
VGGGGGGGSGGSWGEGRERRAARRGPPQQPELLLAHCWQRARSCGSRTSPPGPLHLTALPPPHAHPAGCVYNATAGAHSPQSGIMASWWHPHVLPQGGRHRRCGTRSRAALRCCCLRQASVQCSAGLRRQAGLRARGLPLQMTAEWPRRIWTSAAGNRHLPLLPLPRDQQLHKPIRGLVPGLLRLAQLWQHAAAPVLT